jgi:G3E family GTPase
MSKGKLAVEYQNIIISSLYSIKQYEQCLKMIDLNNFQDWENNKLRISCMININYIHYKERVQEIYNKYLNQEASSDVIFNFLLTILTTKDYPYFVDNFLFIKRHIDIFYNMEDGGKEKYNELNSMLKKIIDNMPGKQKNIYLFSGYLGSGKTTFLNNLKNMNFFRNPLFIFNDIPDFNVDAEKFTDVHKDEINSGCICCTKKEELLQVILNAYITDNIDTIFIESTGISEPIPVISFLKEYLIDINNSIIFVDTRMFHDRFITKISDIRINSEHTTNQECFKSIDKLLIEQIEGGNVIILNKSDLCSAEEIKSVGKYIHGLNHARQEINSNLIKLSFTTVFNWLTTEYNYRALLESPAWIRQLVEHEGRSEIEEYGFKVKEWRFKEPINTAELLIELDIFKKEHNVIRIKGYIVDKMGLVLEINECNTTRLVKDISSEYPFKVSNVICIYI